MAGINRLGKGPAKPGTMRPQDPNKYKTMDIFSEGTEGDKDYQRMVQDIEDTQQNHTGWLFGRGAFDKGDLLYLRDEEEKRRYEEQELRESELRSFARMRQKAETLRDAGQPSAQQQNQETKTQAQTLQPLVRVKPAKAKRRQESSSDAAKRLKPDPSAPPQPAVKTEPETGKSHIPQIKEEPQQEEEEDGLAGLLGGYGSGSEEEEAVPESKPQLPPSRLKRELPLPDIQVKGAVKLEPPVAEPPGPQEVKEEDEFESDFDSSDDSY